MEYLALRKNKRNARARAITVHAERESVRKVVEAYNKALDTLQAGKEEEALQGFLACACKSFHVPSMLKAGELCRKAGQPYAAFTYFQAAYVCDPDFGLSSKILNSVVAMYGEYLSQPNLNVALPMQFSCPLSRHIYRMDEITHRLMRLATIFFVMYLKELAVNYTRGESVNPHLQQGCYYILEALRYEATCCYAPKYNVLTLFARDSKEVPRAHAHYIANINNRMLEALRIQSLAKLKQLRGKITAKIAESGDKNPALYFDLVYINTLCQQVKPIMQMPCVTEAGHTAADAAAVVMRPSG